MMHIIRCISLNALHLQRSVMSAWFKQITELPPFTFFRVHEMVFVQTRRLYMKWNFNLFVSTDTYLHKCRKQDCISVQACVCIHACVFAFHMLLSLVQQVEWNHSRQDAISWRRSWITGETSSMAVILGGGCCRCLLQSDAITWLPDWSR